MTVKDAVSLYSRLLINTDNAVREARLLTSFVTGKSMAEIIAKDDTVLTKKQEESLENAVLRRSAGEPFAYITGFKEFMGYNFKVDRNVLIPRPDTECLVNVALGNEKRVLDLCTGSGCVAVSLAKLMPEANVTAVDVSEGALDVARENARLNGVRVRFIKKNILTEKLDFGKKFDLVTANPPYIESSVLDTLDSGVCDFEPHLALDGGDDGLSFYRKIVAGAELFMLDGGRLCFEIGFSQAKAVSDIMSEKFENIEVIKDAAGLDRVVCGVFSPEKSEKGAHNGHRSRLRKRFINEGLDGFQKHEILELLLFYAIPRRDVNEKAHELIKEFGSFSAVFDSGIDELMKYGKLTENAAVLISLLPQISRIYSKDKWSDKPIMKNYAAVSRYAADLFRGINHEQFYVICLDSSRALLGCEMICEGSVNEVFVYPRLVVKAVLKYDASVIYLAHNHPSGSVVPSWYDYDITMKIKEALSGIDVTLEEHIVVGGNETLGVMSFYKKQEEQ